MLLSCKNKTLMQSNKIFHKNKKASRKLNLTNANEKLYGLRYTLVDISYFMS